MVNNLYVAITIVALSILVFGLVLQNVWLKLQNIKLTTHIFQMEFNHASQADLLIKKIEELDKNKYYDIRKMDPKKIEEEVKNRKLE